MDRIHDSVEQPCQITLVKPERPIEDCLITSLHDLSIMVALGSTDGSMLHQRLDGHHDATLVAGALVAMPTN